ncbi:hypothetical protein BV210_07210 [Halorientalis sp. IM1011]|uniref:hypothetical protein n=1 Tax=Halorientalis sp. IM1011 TaxID=1932360 RepID=UPI00097CD4B9|nr:hypothetical protein [Halorientalis sp. IM1011]AQL42511.1 hypothetical protein BV210_07210 [Halorientalis sp. IM1011]
MVLDTTSVRRRVQFTITDVAFALALLVGTASVWAMATGEPELLAFVAVTGLAVALVGSTVARLAEADTAPTLD